MALPRRSGGYGNTLDLGSLFGALYDMGVFGETEESKRAKERISLTGEEQRKGFAAQAEAKKAEEARKYGGIGAAAGRVGLFGDTDPYTPQFSPEMLADRGREAEALLGSEGLRQGFQSYQPFSLAAKAASGLNLDILNNPAYREAFMRNAIFKAGNEFQVSPGYREKIYTGMNEFEGPYEEESVTQNVMATDPKTGTKIYGEPTKTKKFYPGKVSPRPANQEAGRNALELAQASMAPGVPESSFTVPRQQQFEIPSGTNFVHALQPLGLPDAPPITFPPDPTAVPMSPAPAQPDFTQQQMKSQFGPVAKQLEELLMFLRGGYADTYNKATSPEGNLGKLGSKLKTQSKEAAQQGLDSLEEIYKYLKYHLGGKQAKTVRELQGQ